jgi:hypothetical protein
MTCYRQPFESARILVLASQTVKRYRICETLDFAGKFRLAAALRQRQGSSPPSGP